MSTPSAIFVMLSGGGGIWNRKPRQRERRTHARTHTGDDVSVRSQGKGGSMVSARRGEVSLFTTYADRQSGSGTIGHRVVTYGNEGRRRGYRVAAAAGPRAVTQLMGGRD